LPKITEEQKKRFFNLYKQGFRAWPISRETGITRTYVNRILHEFNSGDFSWLDSGFRHQGKAISEDEKERITKELSESEITWGEAVSKFGFPENTLRMWKRNYNKYGVCTKKRGRPRKDGSNDKRAEKDQRARRRDYYLQNILPGLRGKRDGSAKKRLYERLANAENLESLSEDVLKNWD